jgi:hypothetical protein
VKARLTQKSFAASQNMYSLGIAGASVDPNYWRIHLKLWQDENFCAETYHYVAGQPGCAGNLPKYTCVQLLNGSG